LDSGNHNEDSDELERMEGGADIREKISAQIAVIPRSKAADYDDTVDDHDAGIEFRIHEKGIEGVGRPAELSKACQMKDSPKEHHEERSNKLCDECKNKW
jgi:hypothetical protein